MEDQVRRHYDLLIDEDNDPVNDSKEMIDYMNRWDGQRFIEYMDLRKDKDVLEIGVGTGRIAQRIISNCHLFVGVDLSPKTIKRASENLKIYKNKILICDDFLRVDCKRSYDIVYSTLTFMHIKEKEKAIRKVASILKKSGRFVLSIDKSQEMILDYGTRKIEVFPDRPKETEKNIKNANMVIIEKFETEYAWLYAAEKDENGLERVS